MNFKKIKKISLRFCLRISEKSAVHNFFNTFAILHSSNPHDITVTQLLHASNDSIKFFTFSNNRRSSISTESVRIVMHDADIIVWCAKTRRFPWIEFFKLILSTSHDVLIYHFYVIISPSMTLHVCKTEAMNKFMDYREALFSSESFWPPPTIPMWELHHFPEYKKI